MSFDFSVITEHWRFLASGIQQEPQSRVFYDFRIIMDFELPLF